MNAMDLEKYTIGELPCQGCGKIMAVPIPFKGCPFCGECQAVKSWSLGTEDFTHNES